MRTAVFVDRFLLVERERAIDLASGDEVTLRFVTFRAPAALHEWLRDCAARLSDPDGRLLVDFGVAGVDRYFEALAAPHQKAGSAARHTEIAEAAHRDRTKTMLGLLQQLVEVLEGGVSGRPRALDLAVPSGLTRSHVVNTLARESRLHGYLPVHPGRVQAMAPQVAGAAGLSLCLHGRHVLVLHDGESCCRQAAAGLLVSLGLDSDRPHVLLGVRDRSTPCACAPVPIAARHRAAFDVRRAREQAAAYGPVAATPPAPAGLGAPLSGAAGWGLQPGDADASRPRTRVAQALEAAARGRHATATRALREASAMLVRRGDSAGAAESAFALGRVLLSRGQVEEAARAFEQARRLFEDARNPWRSNTAAIFVGLAWTDAGRWLEAEAAARAAGIAAAAAGDIDTGRLASLALARCLLWQDRIREAAEAMPRDQPGGRAETLPCRLAEAPAVPWADLAAAPAMDLEVARHCLASRIAAADGDIQRAGRAAAQARERAAALGRPLETAVACTSMAAVYALLGDAPAVRVQVDEGLRAARQAHAPLRALRLRAVLASGLLRGGKPSEARPLVMRLSRLDLNALPIVVRRPVEQVLEWKARGTSCAVPGNRPGSPEVVDTVIELLGLSESVTEEEGLARKAVAMLRPRLSGVAVACFGCAEGRVVPVGTDGRDPMPVEIAQRAAETGVALGPGSTKSGLEAAVPVRFGGRIIGALACRWAADVRTQWTTSGAILAAAAAILAPSIRAVLDRRAVPGVPPATPEQIIGVSEGMVALRDEIQRAARVPFNVVIEGESGTGKELVARAIHRLGPRRHHRLCAINCAAMTDELLDAELFGHARGAFTGAVAERKGLFEEADGGTLVLDEVSELSARAQAKLLRAIQEGEIRRVGENLPRVVDTRVVAASNRSLRAAVDAGTFRRDLLYRLDVIRIAVPPLRERVDDIPLLAAYFWQKATTRVDSRATLAPATVAALARYDWPGNVRELQNVMAALAVSAGRRGSVGPERLPSAIARAAANVRGATLDEARRTFEARYVKAALARAGGQRAQAARELGVTRQGLAKLLTRLEIA